MENFNAFLANHVIIDYCFRTLLAFFCGFCLGLERKMKRHTVGIRTLVLMSVSCNLLAMLSIHMSKYGVNRGDPTRIAAGVVTGIGFLGGGAILQQGFNIRGLTSAAIIFTASATGLACGGGLYLQALGILAVVLFTLFTMDKFERKFFPENRIKAIHLAFESSDIDESSIAQLLTDAGLIILDTDVEYSVKKDAVTIIYLVKTPSQVNVFKLAKRISKINKLSDFSFSKK